MLFFKHFAKQFASSKSTHYFFFITCIDVIGDQLKIFLDKNPKVPRDMMLVDNYQFNAFKSVGFGKIGRYIYLDIDRFTHRYVSIYTYTYRDLHTYRIIYLCKICIFVLCIKTYSFKLTILS